jgi:hypothetical protein
MPMRSELSISAMRTGWKAQGTAQGTAFSWRLSESLRNPDVLLLLVLTLIGLLLAASPALLFPLPDDIATALAQLS